jgi:hypothetical protein
MFRVFGGPKFFLGGWPGRRPTVCQTGSGQHRLRSMAEFFRGPSALSRQNVNSGD